MTNRTSVPGQEPALEAFKRCDIELFTRGRIGESMQQVFSDAWDLARLKEFDSKELA